ncbi:MAG TPA: glycine/sarcosine/betaine reductase selenoprotein B family protein [Candidatus Binatia bacterium]|jgi:D-proline reductase (dithiol) PrdB|nr:glycine/sarcosine/betaine reductase selenoprotein B family protein [Candidatus Binatia bacterium]
MKLHRWQNRLFALLFSRFPGLTTRWLKRQRLHDYGPPPWAALPKPLSACTVALVTTAGVHRQDDEPFDMADKEGDPTYRVIPPNAPRDQLCITHDYYDHRDADKDVNIVLPLDRLQELANDGVIGEVGPFHYSFMGHIDGHHVSRLLTKTAPEVARRLKREGVDAVVLTPA